MKCSILKHKSAKDNTKQFIAEVGGLKSFNSNEIADYKIFMDATKQLEQQSIRSYGISGRPWLADDNGFTAVPNYRVLRQIDNVRKRMGLYEGKLPVGAKPSEVVKLKQDQATTVSEPQYSLDTVDRTTKRKIDPEVVRQQPVLVANTEEGDLRGTVIKTEKLSNIVFNNQLAPIVNKLLEIGDPDIIFVKDLNFSTIREYSVSVSAINGVHFTDTGKIYVEFDNPNALKTVLHEAIHFFTVAKMQSNPNDPAVKKLVSLFESYQLVGSATLADTNYSKYGLKDAYEFIAEAFSNPEFVETLKYLAPSVNDNSRSFFQMFIDFVAELLGIKRDPLEEILNAGWEIIRKDLPVNRDIKGYQQMPEPSMPVSPDKVNYQLENWELTDEFIASEKTIRELAARLSDRIGVPYRIISDRSQKFKGRIDMEGVAEINLAYASLDTPVHEILGHPIIRTILKSKPELYQSLLKELETGRGKEVLDRIKRVYSFKKEIPYMSIITKDAALYYDENTQTGYIHDYNNPYERKTFNSEQEVRDYLELNDKYTFEEQQEEAIVELLGLYTADRLNVVKDGKLINLLKRLLKEIKDFMRSLLRQREVDIDKLPDNMTLGDLADLLAYSNSKLILPGYKVVYTTPDNNQFETYAEASKYISTLAKETNLPNLDNITLETTPFTNAESLELDYLEALSFNDNITEEQETRRLFLLNKSQNKVLNFIEKNKQYEQSKEIIEEWKKINNVFYNPQEVYIRNQEFVSVLGAYSSFDTHLMLQNLLQHIEDNQTAGGEFIISAFTQPIDKNISLVEGGGGRIRFKIYPKPADIKWAANADVYSGSVWDAPENINKNKKSELLGVSYTKYPALRNLHYVQPNLSLIIDDLQDHHNELGIALSGNNFRIEYDEDIPYSIKKIIDSVNSILDQKYGKLKKPNIISAFLKEQIKVLQQEKEKLNNYSRERGDIFLLFPDLEYSGIERAILMEDGTYRVILTDIEGNDFIANDRVSKEFILDDFGEKLGRSLLDYDLKIIENAKSKIDSKIEVFQTQLSSLDDNKNDEEKKYEVPTSVQSSKELKESIESVQFKKIKSNSKEYWITKEEYDSSSAEEWTEDGEIFYKDINDEVRLVKNGLSYRKELLIQPEEKEYTSQALINTKIAKLKEVARKYPRSLIRSEVRLIDKKSLFEPFNLPFQKIQFAPSGIDNIYYQLVDNKIDYQLRIVTALQSDKVRQPKINNLQGFFNDIQKQGIPSNQLDLLREIISRKQGEFTKEDLVVDLLSDYSYTVEVSTSKLQEANTQYYSNLTVPGGINYTENEISTPNIVPAIKGHAQFSTKNGIGWFRSDEVLPKANEFEGKDVEDYKKQLEDDGITGWEQDMFIRATFGTAKNSKFKTRRILEVQSDWGQKQRKSSEPDINIKYDIQQIINDLQKSGDLKIDCN
jgi:hypothetical protein